MKLESNGESQDIPTSPDSSFVLLPVKPATEYTVPVFGDGNNINSLSVFTLNSDFEPVLDFEKYVYLLDSKRYLCLGRFLMFLHHSFSDTRSL